MTKISNRAIKLLQKGEDFQVREEAGNYLYILQGASNRGEIALSEYKKCLKMLVIELENALKLVKA